MQKKLIALAVAAVVTAPAFAQTNVTTYGRVELGVMNIDDAAGKGVTEVRSGSIAGSRIGFRGTEDLGNGLKALFQMEVRYAPDTNTQSDNVGYSHLGLAGSFGTALLGRLASPGDMVLGKYTSFSNSTTLTPSTRLRTNSLGAVLNNTAAYVTPNFGGFTAVVAHSVDEKARINQDITGLGLNYDNGPLAVSYVYH
jgi:predicted porin